MIERTMVGYWYINLVKVLYVCSSGTFLIYHIPWIYFMVRSMKLIHGTFHTIDFMVRSMKLIQGTFHTLDY
jgi:hypothetical protein